VPADGLTSRQILCPLDLDHQASTQLLCRIRLGGYSIISVQEPTWLRESCGTPYCKRTIAKANYRLPSQRDGSSEAMICLGRRDDLAIDLVADFTV
jgi:hypothetical protein